MIYALISALAGAGLSITLRRLGKADQPVTVAFVYNFCGFLAISVILALFFHQFMMPDFYQFVLLICLGGFSSLLQLAFTTAYRYSEAVVVSSLRYLQVLLAAILGFFMFSEIPDKFQIAGMIVVISSCMFIIWREFAISRKQTPAR